MSCRDKAPHALSKCDFTPMRFVELLEREQRWFEMFINVVSLPGTPLRARKIMLVERSRWLRN